MKYVDTRKRLLAADKLLRGETTTRQKFESARILIKGINPKVDRAVDEVHKVLRRLEQIQDQKLIELTADNLPENTKRTADFVILLIVFGFFMPKRTQKGVDLLFRIKGLERYMRTAEQYRQKFYEKENIFDKLLPVA